MMQNVTEKAPPKPLPFVALEHIQPVLGKTFPGFDWEEVESDLNIAFNPDDILFGKLRPYLAKVLLADRAGCCTSELLVLRPVKVLPRYAYWLMLAKPVVERAVATSTGVKMPRTRWDRLGRENVELPGPKKQRAIADYLDREIRQIDALVEKKHRMSALWQERLETVISRSTHAECAVVGNQGTLPNGWQLMPLRRCLASSDYGIGEASQSTGPIGVLGMANVDSREIVGAPSGYVTEADPDLLLRSGDLLFNRTNSRELVGKVALVRGNSEPMTFASYLVRLRVGPGVDATYLNYLLNSREVLSVARSLALPSIGQANLNPRRYSAIHIPLPSIEVQQAIARELESTSSTVDAASARLNRQINLLQERRRALITAAVTGQVDIHEAA